MQTDRWLMFACVIYTAANLLILLHLQKDIELGIAKVKHKNVVMSNPHKEDVKKEIRLLCAHLSKRVCAVDWLMEDG